MLWMILCNVGCSSSFSRSSSVNYRVSTMLHRNILAGGTYQVTDPYNSPNPNPLSQRATCFPLHLFVNHQLLCPTCRATLIMWGDTACCAHMYEECCTYYTMTTSTNRFRNDIKMTQTVALGYYQSISTISNCLPSFTSFTTLCRRFW